MKIHSIPFSDIPFFSSRDKSYVTDTGLWRNHIKYLPEEGQIPRVIADKKADKTDRALLVSVLEDQYAPLDPGPLVKNQIRALGQDHVFTVTTAHQPSLLTGPLYYIYKIISTIRYADYLKERFPDFHFVPIFVTGGEDHDFEEVNHVHLFRRTLNWEAEAGGAVGRMSTTSLNPVLAQLKELMGANPNADYLNALFSKTYQSYSQYGPSTQALVHGLFQHLGLVVLNMDDSRLKRAFSLIMQKDILENTSEGLILEEIPWLEDRGFSLQAMPRQINLFLFHEGKRMRLVKGQGDYHLAGTNIEFSEEELLQLLAEAPERFSPNVVLRPLYQEYILPNLAYIGGGGEIAYWLERKRQFKVFGINFPMLIRRHSALWIDKGSSKKMHKTEMVTSDLLKASHEVVHAYVERQSMARLNFEKEKHILGQLFESVHQRVIQVDPTLGKTVLAEQAQQVKSFENLEGKLLRAEKKRHETGVNQIEAVFDRLFPGGKIQERYDNFIPFFLKHGKVFFDTLYTHFKPFRSDFIVIEED